MITLGDNQVSKISKNKITKLGFNKFYNYYFYNIKKKKTLILNTDNCFIFILNGKNKDQILKIKNRLINIKKGELIKIRKKISDSIEIESKSKLLILIIYNSQKLHKQKKLSLKKIKNFYTVKKPWGYEQWLTGVRNKNFAFKKIFLKKGTKTSLQYHVNKIETNFLYNGQAKLHFIDKKIPLLKKNFIKIINSIKTKKITNNSIINVKPNTVHRLEAITNLILFEVSSPHLSDVVRISDDSNRPDGKIKDEHKKKAS